MVKTILLLLLLIFAVAGICELIYNFKMIFHFPGKKFNKYVFVVLDEGFAVRQLDFLWQKMRWQGDGFANGIIALTDKLKTKEIINCAEYIKDKSIVLCPLDEVSEFLNLNGEVLYG